MPMALNDYGVVFQVFSQLSVLTFNLILVSILHKYNAFEAYFI